MGNDSLNAPVEQSTLEVPSAAHEADALPTPPASSIQRRWRAAILLSLLLVLVAALLLVPAENRTALFRVPPIPTASPTTPIQLGNDVFLWERSVHWGRLLVDGKAGPALVDTGPSATPGTGTHTPFRLARGRHTLEYQAALFPTLRCTASVPQASSDTCPLVEAGVSVASAPLTRVFDLQATVDRLPVEQRQALITATQTRLEALAAAKPVGALTAGDHYRDASGQVAQARTDLQLRAQFAVDKDPARFGGGACATICERTNVVDLVSTTDWTLEVAVALSWRYMTPTGEVVLADGPAGEAGTLQSQLIPLHARWAAGGWQVEPPVASAAQTDPVICPTGAEYRSSLVLAQPGPTQDFAWTSGASIPELGCLFVGSGIDVATRQPIGPMFVVLYRAEVLLTVNDSARQWYWATPFASAHDALWRPQ